MEIMQLTKGYTTAPSEQLSDGKAFIEANTIPATISDLKHQHIIPVFIKDNEPVISQFEFIQATTDVAMDVLRGETILKPNIRLSHPIKGRIPEAKNKPANQLLEHEKTLYYERAAFVIEVPSIHTDVAGNQLTLTIGGVKAYNLDNLYSKQGADQHFKIFIGFKNLVCTNLCIASDGLVGNLKVKNIGMLQQAIRSLIQDFNPVSYSQQLNQLTQYELTEQQFAQLIGRCRMYRYLPDHQAKDIPQLMLGDAQLNTVCHDYFADQSFCREDNGNINLWKLYNLFTGANKSSYIDTFLDRSVNALDLVSTIKHAIVHRQECWYLN